MNIPTHTLQKNSIGGYTLQRDGYNTICPFLPAVVLFEQGALAGQMKQTINPNFCCSACPKFELKEIAEQPHVELHCGQLSRYPVTIVEEKTEVKSSLLI